jgi:hypothetical protein
METFYIYKGYGLRYYQILGTTAVELNGLPIKVFPRLGELDGKKAAEKWVDENGKL